MNSKVWLTSLVAGPICVWVATSLGSAAEMRLVGHFQGHDIGGMTAWGDGVTFLVYESGDSQSLWFSDGTEAGTRRIAGNHRFNYTTTLGQSHTCFAHYRRAAARAAFFYMADGALWATSRDALEPVVLASVDADFSCNCSDPCSCGDDGWCINLNIRLAAIGDRVVFTGNDAEHRHELWSSDGAVDGTSIIKDIHQGPDGTEFDGIGGWCDEFGLIGDLVWCYADGQLF